MKQLFQLNRGELDTTAEGFFLRICGFHKQDAKKQHLRENAYAVRADMAKSLHLQAVTRAFSSEIVQDDGLHIEGSFFPCQNLALLNKGQVRAVYAFVLTAGQLPTKQLSPLDTLHRDFWVTAYISAAGRALRKQLEQNHGQPIYISEAIAPGYYDMGADKIVDLMNIIDSAEIGVSLHSFMMKPLKSCAGFYLAVENKEQVSFLDERCQYCHKESGGCAFCAYQQHPHIADCRE